MDEAPSSHPTDLGRLPERGEPSKSGLGEQRVSLIDRCPNPNPRGSTEVTGMGPWEKPQRGREESLTGILGRMGSSEQP